MSVCIFCGSEINANIRPVPIKTLEFRPFIGDEEPGHDIINGAEACPSCYSKVMMNRAKAIQAGSKIPEAK